MNFRIWIESREALLIKGNNKLGLIKKTMSSVILNNIADVYDLSPEDPILQQFLQLVSQLKFRWYPTEDFLSRLDDVVYHLRFFEDDWAREMDRHLRLSDMGIITRTLANAGINGTSDLLFKFRELLDHAIKMAQDPKKPSRYTENYDLLNRAKNILEEIKKLLIHHILNDVVDIYDLEKGDPLVLAVVNEVKKMRFFKSPNEEMVEDLNDTFKFIKSGEHFWANGGDSYYDMQKISNELYYVGVSDYEFWPSYMKLLDHAIESARDPKKPLR